MTLAPVCRADMAEQRAALPPPRTTTSASKWFLYAYSDHERFLELHRVAFRLGHGRFIIDPHPDERRTVAGQPALHQPFELAFVRRPVRGRDAGRLCDGDQIAGARGG